MKTLEYAEAGAAVAVGAATTALGWKVGGRVYDFAQDYFKLNDNVAETGFPIMLATLGFIGGVAFTGYCFHKIKNRLKNSDSRNKAGKLEEIK